MDTAPDAPAASTLDERRPKGTPEHELASFGADSAEAAEPEKPEEEKKATVDAERSVGGAESPDPHPPLTTKRFSKAGLKQVFRPQTPHNPPAKSRPDSAAAPVSPPASDRNATTSAQVKTSASPQPPTAPDPKPQSQTSSPKAQIAHARRSASARNRADQRRHHGCRRAHRRLPTSRDTIPTPNSRSAGRSTALSPAIPSAPLRGQDHPRHASRTAGPNPRHAQDRTRGGNRRSERTDERHARADDKRRGLAGRAP